MRRNVSLVAVLAMSCGSAGFLPPAAALPQGRSWSAVVDTFKIAGHTFGVSPRRLENDDTGRPLAFVEALGGIGQDMCVLRWDDSTWTVIDHLGYGTKGVEAVPSSDRSVHLVWSGLEQILTDRYVSHLVTSELVNGGLTQPDTVTTIYAGSLMYGSAASQARRWVAAGDYGDLRLFYSSHHSQWIEVLVGGRGDRGVALAPLGDTTALLVWRDQNIGPGAGVLDGSAWTLVAPPPMNDLFDAVPRLVARPNGSYWLSWSTERDFIRIASYLTGAWSTPESVYCAYLRPGSHRAQSRAEMSQDGHGFPAIAWMAVSAVNGLTSVCACVPSDSGFPVAENIAGSEDGSAPVVTRDANQDVWVAWEAPTGMGWVHTYTRALPGPPTISGVGNKRVLTWTLSEAAPGSWWSVLRSGDSGPFGAVARVQAGNGVMMSWTDVGPPPAGALHYRVRRECLDRNYQWLSDEVLWPLGVPPTVSPSGALQLVLVSSNPTVGVLQFNVLSASRGPLDIRMYDLKGREVGRLQRWAAGTGLDSIHVELRSVGVIEAGLYFIRVTDATGRVSSSAKCVFLR